VVTNGRQVKGIYEHILHGQPVPSDAMPVW